ncbi:MAG: iron donor protein CyaY [Oligoflexia bacterium]|nr:iron donor protein CyaY [Oligoflexia bacterium]
MQRGDFNTDSEFRHAVQDLLPRLLDQLDDVESDDLDPMVRPGTLLVTFEDGATFILSQQTPTHELWLAANLRAWHFVREDGTWVERDSGQDMLAVLGELIGDKLGLPVVFQA